MNDADRKLPERECPELAEWLINPDPADPYGFCIGIDVVNAIVAAFVKVCRERDRANGIIEKDPHYKRRCQFCNAPLYGLTEEEADKLDQAYKKVIRKLDDDAVAEDQNRRKIE